MPTDVSRSVKQSTPASCAPRRSSSFGATAVRLGRSLAAVTGAMIVLAAFVAFLPAVAAAEDGPDVLEFHVMTPVTGPFVGTTNPIRGIDGGGFPWVIKHGRGHLEGDGELVIRVRGLVLADDPSVPANLRLTNPVANFRGVVSCLSIDSSGQPVTVNVQTDPFPATPQGNAEIVAKVHPPNPCIAPIVFVTSPAGAWFAATGN